MRTKQRLRSLFTPRSRLRPNRSEAARNMLSKRRTSLAKRVADRADLERFRSANRGQAASNLRAIVTQPRVKGQDDPQPSAFLALVGPSIPGIVRETGPCFAAWSWRDALAANQRACDAGSRWFRLTKCPEPRGDELELFREWPQAFQKPTRVRFRRCGLFLRPIQWLSRNGLRCFPSSPFSNRRW